MKSLTSISLFLVYFNFTIIFFLPSYSFYALLILCLYLIFSFFSLKIIDVFKIRSSVYFYNFFFLGLFLFFSILQSGGWNSFGFLLPFFLPIAFLLLATTSSKKYYHSRVILLFFLIFLIGHGQEFFIQSLYIPHIVQMSETQILFSCLVFFPITWIGFFTKNIIWKIFYLLFFIGILLLLIFSGSLFLWIMLIYCGLLFYGNWFRESFFTLLFFFWIILIPALGIFFQFQMPADLQSIIGDFSLHLYKIQANSQIQLIDNFTWLGKGYWVESASNSYQQIYISFGLLGLIGYWLMVVFFILSVFFAMKRKNIRRLIQTRYLWNYSCSLFLFFIITHCYPNFIHPSIFYFVMALWGLCLYHLDFIKSYKKERI